MNLEYEIEKSLRDAIRTSLVAASSATPELSDCRIICFRHDSDSQTFEGNDAYGLRVFITANPNSAEGYNGTYTLEPIRTMQVDISYITQPDSDISRNVFVALETAVRSVFETLPIPFAMPSGVTFGAAMITGAGASEFGDYGQAGSFSVDMKLSV
jgi:hypothetical protein